MKKSERNVLEVAEGFEITADNQCFIVRDWYEYENQDGEMVEDYNETFHKNMLQAVKKVRKELNKACETVEELVELCKQAFELDKEEVDEVIDDRKELDPYRF